MSKPKYFDTAFVKKEKPGKKVSMRIVGFIMGSGISEAMAPRSGVSLYVEFIMSQIFAVKLRDEFAIAEEVVKQVDRPSDIGLAIASR